MSKLDTTQPKNLTNKRKLLGQLLVERGLMNHKLDVLSPYGVEQIRDLSADQLDELIDGLKRVERKKPAKEVPVEVRKARSTVLNLLDDIGIKGKGKDWSAVNNYLLQPRISGKVLYEMSLEELKTCAVKLRAVIRWKADKIEQENKQALNN